MPSSTYSMGPDCCNQCLNQGCCDGYAKNEYNLSIGISRIVDACVVAPSPCGNPDGDFPADAIADDCCWYGFGPEKRVTCDDGSSQIVSVTAQFCIVYYSSDVVVLLSPPSGGLVNYTFPGGNYFLIGTAFIQDPTCTFVRNLGETKPHCSDIPGGLSFAYWESGGGNGNNALSEICSDWVPTSFAIS